MKLPDGEKPAARTPPCDGEIPEIAPEAFAMILMTMRERRGFNLDIYKEKCIKRRIAIRIRKSGSASAAEYGDLLMRDEAETDLLLQVLTVHVSQFFRNPSTFHKLQDEILPHFSSLCERENRQHLDIWSVGCAGGEEPYSVALILKESFADLLSRREVAILGTDIDAQVLATARKGAYREERLLEVPTKLRERWFAAREGKFQLAQEIMDMVNFRRGDLINIDTFPESDLILCRNVLIYLERSHQEKILNGFADALRPGGVLVLGKAENLVGESRRRFQTICPNERIYRVV
ncbi:MAG TPA: protein-glutamate O-methyltransferase CheR [Geobacteraceae bacterium]